VALYGILTAESLAVGNYRLEHLSESYIEGNQALRVRIDREKCIGSANCIASAPTVYRLDETNRALLIDPETVDDETLLLSAESCPTEAIVLEDDEGRRIYPS
jgi:ferredoxin